MNRLNLLTLALLVLSLATVAPEAAWAQADPGEVLDLAVHDGPNTICPESDPDCIPDLRVLQGNFVVFHDGRAQGTVMVRGDDGLFLFDVFAATVTCLLGSPGTITLEADSTHIDRGPPTTDLATIQIMTDIPDCLIWDIVDGSVHLVDNAVIPGGIQIFNNPCD